MLLNVDRYVAVKVAVLSARDHSPNLIPVILVGEVHGSADPAALGSIDWLQEHGGIVYRHNLSFRADIQVWSSGLLHCIQHLLFSCFKLVS